MHKPKPGRYVELQIPISGGRPAWPVREVVMIGCRDCGSIVYNSYQHDKSHKNRKKVKKDGTSSRT